MASPTITIEISREIAVVLVWILAGVIIIGGTFIASYDAVDHWATVNATSLAGALYLGALTGAFLRPPVSNRVRLAGLAFLAALMATGAYGWRSMEETSRWQRGLLLDIRSTIGRGILMRTILPTLEAVEESIPRRHGSTSLGRRFLDVHPGAVVGSNFRTPEWKGDSVQFVVTELSDTAVTVTGIDIARGWDSDFRNVAGRTGLIQTWYRLTKEGISYGIDN